MARKQKNRDNDESLLIYRKSQELETVLDELNVVVLIVDKDYKIKRLNKTALEFSKKKKYSQVLNKKCHEIFFGYKTICDFCPRARVEADLKTLRQTDYRPIQEINAEFDTKPLGRSRYYEQKQYVIEGSEGEDLMVELLTDVSDQREFEEEQARNAKLIALGTAVQTVAHELGNPLTGMRLTLEGLLRKTELAADMRKRLELLQNDLGRAAHVVSEISSYTRRQGYRLVPVEIYTLIKQAIEELKRINSFKFSFSLNWQVSKKQKIMGHEQKLMQVFHNLIQNSLQAFKVQLDKDKKAEPNLWIGAQIDRKVRDKKK